VCAAAMASPARTTIEFDSCGGVVPAHETGVLQQDAVCRYRCSNDRSIVCEPGGDPCPGFADCTPDFFTLGPDARLELNGHRTSLASEAVGVRCDRGNANATCSVIGPGSIVGGKGTGIFGGSANVVVENVVIRATDYSILTHAGSPRPSSSFDPTFDPTL